MSVCSNLTLERSQQALDKIRGNFDTENERLEIVTPDRYTEVFEILKHHFVPDEPLCRTFGVQWEQEFQDLATDVLGKNCSLCMIFKLSNEMMGIRLISYMHCADPPSNYDHMKYEELRELLRFLSCKNKEVDFFRRYEVEEAIQFFTLGVNKKFRQRGLGSRLLEAAVALGKELGFKAVKGEATSNFSQRIYQNAKFECILDMLYDEYTFRGKKLSESTGEHKMTKVFGLKL
ncbi:arylalkylamine N-acetyltransferase-like 2 [Dreissena polymorpha]|nr:arylalkylamine N-acetyltransferase-like 2 [Dreissena polymorpha]XP_052286731.1 arylalkylamine N-acetyltransferase-like 2 [Dreissena polymorpha]XP_052286732.1 arylalkylamine N-acetyltransferase-like 2 [Dreissena polymorpha]XP_052286733.1 arylalkylamine N-acetyltransferase-like 2 [Dreissena polymorpha]